MPEKEAATDPVTDEELEHSALLQALRPKPIPLGLLAPQPESTGAQTP